MASNTRDAVKEAQRIRTQLSEDYLSRFLALFHNSVKVRNEGTLPKRYLLGQLLRRGAIAYDRQTELYLRFVPAGIDVYGLPTRYTLIGYNGLAVERKPEEVVILRANDLRYPFVRYYEMQARKLADFDMAIRQNLDATKTMSIAEVTDNSQLLSVANEAYARQVGATLVVKNKQPASGAGITVQSTGAEYLVDRMLQDRSEILNETLATIGCVSANTSKRERVQSLEVTASNGYAFDCLHTLVDTFNYDAEYGGIPIRLEENTSLAEMQESKDIGDESKDEI